MNRPASQPSTTTRISGGGSWHWFAEPEPGREYVALTTYFQLRSPLGVPRFLLHSGRVQRQLARTPGLVGYALRGRLWRYWTLSAWESGHHLSEFMASPPHRAAMHTLRGLMARFGTAEWTAPGSSLPLAWPDALRRLAENQPDR